MSSGPTIITAEEQKECDVAIVGGGVIGSSIAYFLADKLSTFFVCLHARCLSVVPHFCRTPSGVAERAGKPVSVTVFEKDDSYEFCSTARSASMRLHCFCYLFFFPLFHVLFTRPFLCDCLQALSGISFPHPKTSPSLRSALSFCVNCPNTCQ